jgi:hypothetical protein
MSIVGGGPIESDAPMDPSRTRACSWLAAVLVASVIAQLLGAFVRYATFPGSPATSNADPLGALPATPSFSYSLYHGMQWGRPAFFVTLALTATLGWIIANRPSRTSLAFVPGFSAYNLASTSYLTWLWSRAHSLLGPGFFLTFGGLAMLSVVAISAVVMLRPFPRPANLLSTRTVSLGAASAIAIGVSTTIFDLRVPFAPLATFTPLTFSSATTATIAFVAVAAFPLVALRLGNRVGCYLLVGLATGTSIRVIDALLRRFGNWRGQPVSAHLSVGWWIEILAIVLLLATTRELRLTDPDTVTAPSDAPT